jgi:hypothetical protein
MNRNENRRATHNARLAALAAVALLVGLSSCNLANPEGQPVTIAIKAGIPQSAGRAVSPGTAITTIDAYKVVFHKIEIGNSETDKFTLWESAAGETKDITSAVSFSGVKPVKAGSYQFVRLTVGTTLAVDGSITDAGTVYTGSGTATLSETTYLWGTAAAGNGKLTAPVTIRDGSVLDFNFLVAGTVTYGGGPADAAVLGVSKPELTVIVE